MSGVTTYLDFGMTKGGKRTSYDYREGQIAYDLFMGARYLNDLIAYRNDSVDEVYHPEDLRDALRKYTGLTSCRRNGDPLSYYEIGSSVMGAIDSIEYFNRQYHELETTQIRWYGVDNSRFMNAMAIYTHQQHDVRLSETANVVSADLFFAKGVSLLYAFERADHLCDVLNGCRLAIFDYTFAREGTIAEFVGTGLPVTFLNLAECERRLRSDGKTLLLQPYTVKTYHQSANKITYDCVYGESTLVDRYLAEIERRTAAFETEWQRPLIRQARPGPLACV